jgi:pimeloyl-ACP methyl ester carboxylesterase
MAASGVAYDVYCEEAGVGIPVIFLHTAGADSRQYGALLADTSLAARVRLIAFDLPFHGRSLPPLEWDGGAYRLDQRTYSQWVVGFLEQIVGERAILVGCSMGAAIALVIAAQRPDLLRGVIALEPPLRSPGRRNPYLAHACVSGGTHNGAYVHGLMSPTSPESLRRRAAWIYAQGGPGVYSGDLGFYSDEFDGNIVGPKIDTCRVPVALMTGEYDYSATVEDGQALAALIPGSRFISMPDLGHFPMTENPDLFITFFAPVLHEMAGR